MNGARIERILKNDPKSSQIFRGVFAIDQLPRKPHKPALLVCNTDPHDRPGQHWIVIYLRDDDYGEYFDSFGQPPPTIFNNYLNRNCKYWTFSDRQLQSVISRFCGHYCIYYSLWRSRGMDINAVTTRFSTDTAVNDYLVHDFVCNK